MARPMARVPLLLLVALAATAAAADEYAIGVGDVLHVAVLGQAEMTGDFAVDGDGAVAFPFLGKVKAAGLTASDLARSLTALLADGYLREPRVSVAVKEFHSRRVFVTGEVARPGAYGLRPERSLLALLRDVGDLTAAVGHEALVIRPPAPGTDPSPAPAGSPPPAVPRAPGLPDTPGARIFHVSLRDLRSGNPEKDFPLEAGDTVYFPRAAQVYVTGNVGRPGAFRFEEGLTVYQALNMAGGITEKGSSKVHVVRIVDGQRKELRVKPTDLIQPEDTIVVPERFF